MEQDELWNRNVCGSGHFHILRKKTNRSPCRIIQMWALIAVVFLPCLATLCCCLLGCRSILTEGQGRELGPPARYPHCGVPLAQPKAVLRWGELLSPVVGRKMQAHTSVHFEADVRKRAAAEPNAVRNHLFWQLRCLAAPLTSTAFSEPFGISAASSTAAGFDYSLETV